jgi:hypothetical protein
LQKVLALVRNLGQIAIAIAIKAMAIFF